MTETRDGFLGGRVHLWQPAKGFRAGSDAVFLAAACPARPGQSVLDLGCGVGAAMYCLSARVPDLVLTGLERDPAAADMARRNGDAEVVDGDVLDMPAFLRRGFDHVICNPPYFPPGAGSAAVDPGREAALREGVDGDLSRWLRAACKRVSPGGSVTAIARADRLADLLGGIADLGGRVVLPLAARPGQSAGRVIVQGWKGRRTPLRLLPPFVIHSVARHDADPETHSPEARAVLRDGAALTLS